MQNSYKKSFGGEATGGEKTYSPKERAGIRPTIEINGIHGATAATAFKTVIPAKLFAKVSCRLVPNQRPEKILSLVAQFLRDHAPQGVIVEVHSSRRRRSCCPNQPSAEVGKVFAQAFSEVFNKPCTYILEGGSIPIVTALKESSNAEVVMIGVGLDSDGAHAPNEHFSLDVSKKDVLSLHED